MNCDNIMYTQYYIINWFSIFSNTNKNNLLLSTVCKIHVQNVVFLGSVRSGSSSLNLELEPELEPAHLAVFRTRTEPEPIIPELEPNPNPWYLNSNRTRTLSMGSVRVQFKIHEQVWVQSRVLTELACTKTIE